MCIRDSPISIGNNQAYKGLLDLFSIVDIIYKTANLIYMKVSVIIPNFNYDQYIEQAITSVLNSNFDRNEMEIIVVDDASTDNSVVAVSYTHLM